MNSKEAERYKAMCSKQGLMLEATDGEPISVRIGENGTISLATRLSTDHGGLGSFEIRGLDPEKAAAKEKGFWQKLWDKVKGAAAAIADAITVPLFGYRCRPDIDVNLKDNKFVFGIKCTEA